MNAKELLQEWKERCNRLPRTAGEEDYQTILRALSLLAAAEANDGTTPETDAEFQLACKGAVAKDRLEKFSSRSLWDFARRLERERNAALRALDQAKEE